MLLLALNVGRSFWTREGDDLVSCVPCCLNDLKALRRLHSETCLKRREKDCKSSCMTYQPRLSLAIERQNCHCDLVKYPGMALTSYVNQLISHIALGEIGVGEARLRGGQQSKGGKEGLGN